ncbi:hypothetical protein [Shewanella marina]|uniref:hypothetical protein n=1 Tax=Shewanella marina TaxID=487319 RepID=UPI00046FA9D0|nr:hypothetical protein [Shewanella marina]
MASLTHAYSVEFEQIIDAELAYDLYWTGIIRNKSSFQCPCTECQAKVTCINLDQIKQNMRQTPHFRSYCHSSQCTIQHQTDKLLNEQTITTASFHLQRPSQQLQPKQSCSAPNNSLLLNSSPKHTSIEKQASHPHYYSVRSLVTNFIKFRQQQTLENHKIKIETHEICYQDLFKGIYKQPLDKLPEQNCIYWGLAYVDYNPQKQFYRITFIQTLTHNEQMIRPSLFISEREIERYPVKKLLLSRLTNITEQKDKRAFIFVYGKPTLHEDRFINFKVSNLDHLEIRTLELFDQLKRTVKS